jgi:hypothetical protein
MISVETITPNRVIRILINHFIRGVLKLMKTASLALDDLTVFVNLKYRDS